METILHVHYYNNGEKRIIGIDITPLAMIGRGINPGRAEKSITVIGKGEKESNSSDSYYYKNKEDAKKSAINILKDSIRDTSNQIREELDNIIAMKKVLNTLLVED